MIRQVSAGDLAALRADAVAVMRRRAHLVTHETPDAEVQRMYIALEPDTYIRPHRHVPAHKWEFFLLVEGALDLLIFDDTGVLEERRSLSQSALRSVEIPAGTWHAYVCVAPHTLGFEIKQGPYDAATASEFASWAPAEGTPDARRYVEWMRNAQANNAG